jgi:hypothetical protein
LDVSSSGLCRHLQFRIIHCLIGIQCPSKLALWFYSINLIMFIFSSGMEQFWQSAFAWFFRPLWVNSDHLWTLSPISSPPVCQVWPWHTITYSAKVRFQCPVSLHPWLTIRWHILNVLFFGLVQTWLDIDERTRGVLVSYASPWKRYYFGSSFQALWPTVQSMLQKSPGIILATKLSKWTNKTIDYFAGFSHSAVVSWRNWECCPFSSLWSGQNLLRWWETSSSTSTSPRQSE